ncbi:hypothetical protein PHAVU_006G136900 [Phaseolus vulgaris]|uniref:Endonuclease/exonuclease/phosphatase domain-containing protein n=1 Tax=Phaseolus vulgaris TaxID=3885 RepID=V7BNK5_PHAVU|nr:hypothetical protein PHAVU_006G136900g [Phaseolus vulgaris]ESW19579.1 hypothetical protein PHAVU_006G136900g [Phaseolus vulgaris]
MCCSTQIVVTLNWAMYYEILLDKVYKLSQEWGNIHVIIAGDLNSVPKSAIYKFLSSSKIMEEPKGYEEMRNIFRSQIPDDASISMTLSRQLLYRWSVEELRLATGAKGITYLQHLLKLRSAIVVFLYAVLICQIKLLPLAISATSL